VLVEGKQGDREIDRERDRETVPVRSRVVKEDLISTPARHSTPASPIGLCASIKVEMVFELVIILAK
jgi:hypothetical protein